MQNVVDQGMGLNYRRRVVYRALTQCFVDESRARRYFMLWNREFSTQAHVALARFVTAVAHDAGLDATARGRLQRALYESLTLRYEQLARVPDDWMPAANHTGEFPALPAAEPPASGRPLGAQPATPASPAALQPRAGQRAAPLAAASAATSVSMPSPTASVAPPFAPSTPISVGAAPIERADRTVFRALAEPMIGLVLADTDPHPGLLEIALADLAQTLEAVEAPAYARLSAWARVRFLDRDLPVMADTEGYRSLLALLRRLLTDLGGEALADRIIADALARARELPQARLCPPLLLI